MRFFLAALSLALLSLTSAQLSTIYWPISTPSQQNPWVVGQKNIIAWQTGGGTGIDSFDIQLHNSNRSIMTGFIPVVLRVPMEHLPGTKVYGGEIEVDLNLGNIPTGQVLQPVYPTAPTEPKSWLSPGTPIPLSDGFRLIFLNTYHGQIYATSQGFTIYPSAPANYTSDTQLPTATVTATVTQIPNPTQQYALTLNGINPDSTQTAVQIAGNAGSGSS